MTELTSSGGLAGNFAPSGADFFFPVAVAIDAAGNAWVTNEDGNSVTELTSSGAWPATSLPRGLQRSGRRGNRRHRQRLAAK